MKALLPAVLGVGCGLAFADEPRHLRVVATAGTVNLRAEAHVRAKVVGRIPVGRVCLTSLGCQGNPPWCKLDVDGRVGWADARYLKADNRCATRHATPVRQDLALGAGQRQATVSGIVRGAEYAEYRVFAQANAMLAVTLGESSGGTYFNILQVDTDTPLFIGALSGSHFSGALPAAGEYLIRIYLPRAAARKNQSGRYRLDMSMD